MLKQLIDFDLNQSRANLIFSDDLVANPVCPDRFEKEILMQNLKFKYSKALSEYTKLTDREPQNVDRKYTSSINVKPSLKISSFKVMSSSRCNEKKSSGKRVEFLDQISFTEVQSDEDSLIDLDEKQDVEIQSSSNQAFLKETETSRAQGNLANIDQKRRISYIKYRNSVNISKDSRKQSAVEFQLMQKAIIKSFSNVYFESYFTRIRHIEVALGALSLVNIIASIVDVQIFANRFAAIGLQAQNDPLTLAENMLRAINIVISFLMTFLIYLRYKCLLTKKKSDQTLSQKDTMASSSDFKYCILESAISLVFYPPLLTGIYVGEVNQYRYCIAINSIITLVIFIKVYHLIRAYIHFSKYSNFDAQSICNKFKVSGKETFLIKAEIKARPKLMIGIILVSFTLFMSFFLRTFEGGVSAFTKIDRLASEESEQLSFIKIPPGKGVVDLSYIYNCWWFIIETITTVGYGDAYPKTLIGRTVGALACIIGIFLIALITNSLSQYIEFDQQESKAFFVMKKMQLEVGMGKKAIHIIKAVLEMNKLARERKSKASLYHFIKPKMSKSKKSMFDLKQFPMSNNLETIKSLSKQFILFTHLKKFISTFMLDKSSFKALSYDEKLLNMRSTLKSELQKLSASTDMISAINIEINELTSSLKVNNKKISDVFAKQARILGYLINLNNRKSSENLKFKVYPILKSSYGDIKRIKYKSSHHEAILFNSDISTKCDSMKRSAFTISDGDILKYNETSSTSLKPKLKFKFEKPLSPTRIGSYNVNADYLSELMEKTGIDSDMLKITKSISDHAVISKLKNKNHLGNQLKESMLIPDLNGLSLARSTSKSILVRHKCKDY